MPIPGWRPGRGRFALEAQGVGKRPTGWGGRLPVKERESLPWRLTEAQAAMMVTPSAIF